MPGVDEVLAKYRKRHGDQVAQFGANRPAPQRIPTGILEFDIATAGGFPKGHMSVIWGGADSGKSTMLYKSMATYLEQNEDKVAFFDLEGNYDSEYGLPIGIDEDRVMFCEPDFAEHACDMIVDLIRAEDVGLICVDSLAAFCSEKEDEKSFEDSVMGRGGLLVSRLCRVSRNRLNDQRRKGHAPTVLYVNQERANLKSRHGGKSMPGGHAPRFFSSMLVKLWGGREEVDADVDPNIALWKEIEGQVEKKKGPIVCKNFKFKMCVVPNKGPRPGDTKDWSTAAAYLGDMGQFGKTGKKGWQIMGNEFRLQKECLAWYEEHRLEARDAIIDYLTRNPDAI